MRVGHARCVGGCMYVQCMCACAWMQVARVQTPFVGDATGRPMGANEGKEGKGREGKEAVLMTRVASPRVAWRVGVGSTSTQTNMHASATVAWLASTAGQPSGCGKMEVGDRLSMRSRGEGRRSGRGGEGRGGTEEGGEWRAVHLQCVCAPRREARCARACVQ